MKEVLDEDRRLTCDEAAESVEISHGSAPEIITGIITKTRLFKYIENFTTKKKNENFQIKNSDVFHISAQNIDCGYSLEPPRRGGSNEYPQSVFLSRKK